MLLIKLLGLSVLVWSCYLFLCPGDSLGLDRFVDFICSLVLILMAGKFIMEEWSECVMLEVILCFLTSCCVDDDLTDRPDLSSTGIDITVRKSFFSS